MMSSTEIMVAGFDAPTLSFITVFNITEISSSMFILVIFSP